MLIAGIGYIIILMFKKIDFRKRFSHGERFEKLRLSILLENRMRGDLL